MFSDQSFQGVLVGELLPYIFFCLTVITAIFVLFVIHLQVIQCEHEKCWVLSFSTYSSCACLHNSSHTQGKYRPSYIFSGHTCCYSSLHLTCLHVIKQSGSPRQHAYNY